jgi:hypothetical protein
LGFPITREQFLKGDFLFRTKKDDELSQEGIGCDIPIRMREYQQKIDVDAQTCHCTGSGIEILFKMTFVISNETRAC